MKRPYVAILIGVFVVVFAFLVRFDMGLAAGIFVLLLLAFGTLLYLRRLGIDKNKGVALLFITTLVIHLTATLFIHYTEFYPFGGGEGDQRLYHAAAVAIAEDFRQGNFSLEDIRMHLQEHSLKQSYSVVIAGVYAVILPDQIVGKMFNVWLVGVSILLLYGLAREIGGSHRGALMVSFLGNLYPSYVYFGSLLLREAFVICLTLLSALLVAKIMKKFSWRMILLFYVVLFVLIHFRFYIGFAMLFGFALCFLIFSHLAWRQRFDEKIAVVLLLGFLPSLLGYGYYGIDIVQNYLQPSSIALYRERAYTSQNMLAPITVVETPEIQEPPEDTFKPLSSDVAVPPLAVADIAQPKPSVLGTTSTIPSVEPSSVESPLFDAALPSLSKNVDGGDSVVQEERKDGSGSTVIVPAGLDNPLSFVKNYATSFTFVSLGPLPWHAKYTRHLLIFLETIPWYILLGFIFYGAFKGRRQYRVIIPIILISAGLIGGIALLVDNFGVYMRIRMPAFLMLLSLAAFYPHMDKVTDVLLRKIAFIRRIA